MRRHRHPLVAFRPCRAPSRWAEGGPPLLEEVGGLPGEARKAAKRLARGDPAVWAPKKPCRKGEHNADHMYDKGVPNIWHWPMCSGCESTMIFWTIGVAMLFTLLKKGLLLAGDFWRLKPEPIKEVSDMIRDFQVDSP